MALSQTVRAALVGIASTAGALFVFRGGVTPTASDPLDAMPAGSFLVATIDVAALRRAPAYEAVLGKDGASRTLGMGSLADACGFDPISRVSKVAVAVPEQGDPGELGIAAKIAVTQQELETCTKALGDKNGKRVEVKQVGAYMVVEGPTGSRIAYGPSGLLLIGRGAWLDAMMATADHQKPGAKVEPAHAALRKTMSAKSPTVVITAVLPKTLRDRLRGDMEKEGAAAPSALSMLGVLGVATVGIAFEAGVAGGRTQLTAELTCDTVEACDAVDKLVVRQRTTWSRDLMMRLGGLGPLVESIATAPKGDHLAVTASADTDGLTSALESLVKLRSHGPPSTPALPGGPPARLPRPYQRQPDERVDPKP